MNEELLKAKASSVGNIPSGLFIVCARDKESGMIDGFLASWIQQVSFEPLLVSLCIKPGRPVYELIKSNSIFTINVVGEHEKTYLKHFWSGYNPEKNPFSKIPHEVLENGAVILKDAKSSLVCSLEESSKPGDHELVIAKVLEGHILNEEAKPTSYTRKSGLEY